MPRPPRDARPSVRSRLRRLVVVALATALVVVLAGCHVQLDTTVEVGDDGSGTITQAVGLDAAAMARVGDLSQQLATDDLVAAGWTVDQPVVEGDTTWVRIHHDFDDVAEANQLLASLSGPNGPYRDLAVARDAGILSTSTEITGTIDLSAGPSLFGDDALIATLGGDPAPGYVSQLEAAEGQPVSEMLDVSLTARLPGGETGTWEAGLGAAPVPVEASTSQSHLTGLLWKGLLLLVVLLTLAVVGLRIRVRYRRRKRMMRSATRRIQF